MIGSLIDINPNVCYGLVFSDFLFISGQKEGLFLIDFCYFVNLSTILQVHGKHIIHLNKCTLALLVHSVSPINIQIFLAPDNWTWFTTNYVLCLGCLMNAIVVRICHKLSSYFCHIYIILSTHFKFSPHISSYLQQNYILHLRQVWQNCLMLHSFDRITSLFIHALAPLTLHVIRFSSSTSSLALQSSSSSLWPVTSIAPRCYIRHYFCGVCEQEDEALFCFH